MGLYGFIILDIDECYEKLAGCSQICTNTAGGFNCSCNSGFYLGWDKRICIGKMLFAFVHLT